MRTRYSVHFYIKDKAARIKSATDHEAAQHKLDAKRFNQLVIQEAIERADTYSDDYGAQGFFKWLANVILICRRGYDHINQSRVKLPEAVEPLVNVANPFLINPRTEDTNGKPMTVGPIVEDNYKPEEKMCKMGNHVKPLTAFYNQPKNADGKDSSCKECRGNAAKANRLGKLTQSKLEKPIPQVIVAPGYPKVIEPIQKHDVGFSNDELTILIVEVDQRIAEKEKLIAGLTEHLEQYRVVREKLVRRKK